MRMFKVVWIVAAIMPFMLLSCSDDSTSSDEGEGTSLAVRIVNTGSGDLDIQSGGEDSTYFCYAGEECSGGSSCCSFATIFQGQSDLFNISNPERDAVGAEVGFRVESGQGRFEIVLGTAYYDDGWLEFEESEILYTSEEFTSGSVSYSYTRD
jgi:hypothetical protein